MKTFIYSVDRQSTERGCNRTITVHRIKNNVPVFVGYDNKVNTASYKVNTTSYKGDEAVACAIINRELKHKLKHGGYALESKNIQLFEV